LTKNIPNFCSDEIKCVRVLKGGRAFSFRTKEVPEGEMIMQNEENIPKEELSALEDSDSYLVLIQMA
jgi:hypothetical protein